MEAQKNNNQSLKILLRKQQALTSGMEHYNLSFLDNTAPASYITPGTFCSRNIPCSEVAKIIL